MVELDFNPQVGELVEVFPHEGRFEGLFEIIGRHVGALGLLLDLKRCRDGRIVKDVATFLVDYPQEERIRRAIHKVLSDPLGWPEDFQRGRFDTKAEPMYDGTPRTMVYFYLNPGVKPSLEKARIWNEFYSKLQRTLEPITDADWDWIQFSAKEDRGAQVAAS
ncbi:MAG TPA: hypothetical protein VLZ50_00310 [Terracidiphilus sp.]|nr:hypothetical protein [Terracidiphilus sp.]